MSDFINVAKVADPLGGSYFVEELTDEMERQAEEIFTTVSRYTETVTRAVTAHGGTVVEVNGDGMMAGFGEAQEQEMPCA